MPINLFEIFKKKEKQVSGETEQQQKAVKGMGGAPNTPASTPAEKLAEGMLNVRDIIAPSAKPAGIHVKHEFPC